MDPRSAHERADPSRADADRLHAALRRSFEELVAHVEGATFDVRDGYAVAMCPAVPLPQFNGVWAEGPDEALVVSHLGEAVAAVEGRRLPCWVVLRPDRTPTIREACRRIGLTDEDAMPAMVATPAELPADDGRGDPTVDVDLVRDRHALDEALELVAAGFGAPREVIAAVFTPEVLAIPGLSVLVVRAGGRPVSTVTAVAIDGTVGIFNVATPPGDRGHGYASIATLRAAHTGFAAGADLAWLQASAMGEPVYRRLGFRQVGTYAIMGRPAGRR
jgi:hypothetical protein